MYQAVEVTIKKKAKYPHESACYGFVKFSTVEYSEKCLKDMNGYLFMGRNIRIAKECPVASMRSISEYLKL